MGTEERMELVIEHRQKGGVALQMVGPSFLIGLYSISPQVDPFYSVCVPLSLHCRSLSSLDKDEQSHQSSSEVQASSCHSLLMCWVHQLL